MVVVDLLYFLPYFVLLRSYRFRGTTKGHSRHCLPKLPFTQPLFFEAFLDLKQFTVSEGSLCIFEGLAGFAER